MIKFFPNSETFLALGNISIRWYAILILTGAFVCYLFCRIDYKKSKYTDIDFLETLIVYSLFFGVIGSRLWYCAFDYSRSISFYISNPVEIIKVWNGGLAIQGGLVGGALFAYFYCRNNKYPFLKMLDIVMPNILIAQAFGRWGNYINKECFGPVVDETYYDGILSFLKEGMYIQGNYYEPMFFYESMLCLLGFVIIRYVLKKYQNRRGDLFYCYLLWYGVIRFFIEDKRTDSLLIGTLKMAQVTSIVFVVVGLLGYFGLLRKLTSKNKPTIIFDFDGTLMDTTGSIHEGFKACFEKYSDPSLFTDEVKNEVLGPALKDIFPKYFPDVDYDTVYETYKTRQREVTPTLTHPTTNAKETLQKLHESGYKVGIVSTRTKEGISELLKMHDMDSYIDDICGLKDVTNLKPDPEGIVNMINKNKWNRDCVMIGDSLMDLKCGNNYGAYAVAYLDNPARSKQMAETANASITDLEQLFDILNNKEISFTYNKL